MLTVRAPPTSVAGCGLLVFELVHTIGPFFLREGLRSRSLKYLFSMSLPWATVRR